MGFFPFHLGERLIHCGTDELHELIEIYWLSPWQAPYCITSLTYVLWYPCCASLGLKVQCVLPPNLISNEGVRMGTLLTLLSHMHAKACFPWASERFEDNLDCFCYASDLRVFIFFLLTIEWSLVAVKNDAFLVEWNLMLLFSGSFSCCLQVLTIQ